MVVRARRRRFGEQPGELAPNIVALRQGAHLRLPRLETVLTDGRLAAVIEHEGRRGTARHELHHVAELVMGGAQIEREAEPPDRTHAIDERGPNAEVRRFALNVLPDPLDAWHRGELLERSLAPCHVRAIERDEGDDAADARITRPQGVEPARLAKGVGRRAVGLHDNDAVDWDARRGVEVLGHERSVERRNLAQPRIRQ